MGQLDWIGPISPPRVESVEEQGRGGKQYLMHTGTNVNAEVLVYKFRNVMYTCMFKQFPHLYTPCVHFCLLFGSVLCSFQFSGNECLQTMSGHFDNCVDIPFTL